MVYQQLSRQFSQRLMRYPSLDMRGGSLPVYPDPTILFVSTVRIKKIETICEPSSQHSSCCSSRIHKAHKCYDLSAK